MLLEPPNSDLVNTARFLTTKVVKASLCKIFQYLVPLMFMSMLMFHFKYETGTVKYLAGEATTSDRRKEDTEGDMAEAPRTGQHVCDVKGP